MKKNPNEMMLMGMTCPKCGSFGPFEIAAIIAVMVSDGGADIGGIEPMWGDESDCTCPACTHTGIGQGARGGCLSKEELEALGYEFLVDQDNKAFIYFTTPDDEPSESFLDESDAIRAASANAKEVYEISRCGNCGRVHNEQTLVAIKDMSERTDPGSVVPSGECPDCGALCYLIG